MEMNPTITWSVDSMQSLPHEVMGHRVQRVYFTVTAAGVLPDGQEVSVSISPNTIIAPSDEEENYDTLTEAQVLAWVKESFGAWNVENITEMVAKQLANKIFTAEAVVLPLPWVTQ
jgi:hypothetical protein